MKSNSTFTSSDLPTILGMKSLADNFPPIEEVEISTNETDPNRLEFVFENTTELQRKLSAFRKRELRVEPSQYFHLCKQIKQELRYLKESLEKPTENHQFNR